MDCVGEEESHHSAHSYLQAMISCRNKDVASITVLELFAHHPLRVIQV